MREEQSNRWRSATRWHAARFGANWSSWCARLIPRHILILRCHRGGDVGQSRRGGDARGSHTRLRGTQRRARSSAEPYRHELNTSTVAERIVGSTAFRVEQEQCRAGSDSLRYEGKRPEIWSGVDGDLGEHLLGTALTAIRFFTALIRVAFCSLKDLFVSSLETFYRLFPLSPLQVSSTASVLHFRARTARRRSCLARGRDSYPLKEFLVPSMCEREYPVRPAPRPSSCGCIL